MMLGLLLALVASLSGTAYEACHKSSDCDASQHCEMNADASLGHCVPVCEKLDNECPAHASGKGTPTCEPSPCDMEDGECGGLCDLTCDTNSDCPNDFACWSGSCLPNEF